MNPIWTVVIVLAAVCLLVIILAAVAMYIVAYARELPPIADKIFAQNSGDEEAKKPLEEKHQMIYEETSAWLKAQPKKQDLYIKSFDGLKLHSVFLPADIPTKKTIHVVHGFHAEGLWDFATMIPYYHNAGYNVNIPDDRAHLNSEGKLLGFGWNDRRDTIDWCRKLIEVVGEDAEIVLHGVSMGAATVMMASGEKDLPVQVKCIIEDCGFSSAMAEFRHTAPSQIHFMIDGVLFFDNIINRIFNHYWIYGASSVKQLKKAKVPFFFIHGDSDTFVPTAMVYDNYNACASEKEIWVTKDVPHAKSSIIYTEEYGKKCLEFMEKHLRRTASETK